MTPVRDVMLLQRFSPTIEALLQLLEAGYPFQKAVDVLASCEESLFYKTRLMHMSSQLDQGAAFHVTLKQLLPQSVYLAIWDVGAVPDMRTLLRHLGPYVFQKTQALTGLFRSLAYPCVLLIGLLSVLVLFVFHVVPTMAGLTQGQASGLLAGLLAFRAVVIAHLGGVIAGSLLLCVAGVYVLFRYGWRWLLARWFSPGPADVSWLLGVLLSNGMSIESGLQALTVSSKNERLRWVQAELLQSGQFSSGFIRFFRVKGVHAQLLVVAEKSGALSTRLITVGQSLLAEEMHQIKRRIGLVQPVLLVVVGVMIWFLMQVVMAPLSSMVEMM